MSGIVSIIRLLLHNEAGGLMRDYINLWLGMIVEEIGRYDLHRNCRV